MVLWDRHVRGRIGGIEVRYEVQTDEKGNIVSVSIRFRNTFTYIIVSQLIDGSVSVDVQGNLMAINPQGANRALVRLADAR